MIKEINEYLQSSQEPKEKPDRDISIKFDDLVREFVRYWEKQSDRTDVCFMRGTFFLLTYPKNWSEKHQRLFIEFAKGKEITDIPEEYTNYFTLPSPSTEKKEL